MSGMHTALLPMDVDTARNGSDQPPLGSQLQPDVSLNEYRILGEGAPYNLLNATGAGPLPTDFGIVSSQQSTGSVLSDFTKRRNWSQRAIEELKDFLHILTPDGRTLYVSPSTRSLTGWESKDLVGKFLVDFVHQDDCGMFLREFNESIASGHPLRFFYRFRTVDSSYTIFEAHGHPHLSADPSKFDRNATATSCRGFFMMSRPYPSKNASLLDSFLEHKIEAERLTRRITDLRREEAEEADLQQQQWAKQKDSNSVPPSPLAESAEPAASLMPPNTVPDYHGMPPPARPSISNTALTQQNLDEANASSKPDSINDKMARYEGATHIDSIEMLTGLRYREGERSKGISTGDVSPALIRGDAGIAISVDKEGRLADKKKKLKVADEYVCTDCGTLDSPEWRKGPSGPKTLCNACGREYYDCDVQPMLRSDADSSSALGKEGEEKDAHDDTSSSRTRITDNFFRGRSSWQRGRGAADLTSGSFVLILNFY